MKIERRFLKNTQIRAKEDGHVEGHAAVFNQEYVLYEGSNYRVVETVKPGAFTRALKEKHDVRCLFNHDPNQLLGRTASGTMKLKQDDDGLYFDCTVPDTQLGRDVLTLVKRGDVSGASFAFNVTAQTWREEKKDGVTISTREIEDVDLFDASPVTYPAYTGTDVSARAARVECRSNLLAMKDLPADIRHVLERDDEEMSACSCACRACYSAECDECEMHMVDCGDEKNCDHSMSRSIRSIVRGDKPTKRVDGEDLTADCFIYVGDPEKPETWALPWKFKSDAKKKSHLRNALARFDQTKKIPDDKKASAYKKLARLCKKYGITVTDDEAKAWGITPEQRDILRATIGGGKDCECDCPECQVGDCENCSEPDCDDENCHHDRVDEDDRSADLIEVDARLRQAGLKPTA